VYVWNGLQIPWMLLICWLDCGLFFVLSTDLGCPWSLINHCETLQWFGCLHVVLVEGIEKSQASWKSEVLLLFNISLVVWKSTAKLGWNTLFSCHSCACSLFYNGVKDELDRVHSCFIVNTHHFLFVSCHREGWCTRLWMAQLWRLKARSHHSV